MGIIRTTARRIRLLCIASLAIACFPYQPVTAPLAANLPPDSTLEVRITRRGGQQVSMVRAHIAGDSLMGREIESNAPLAFGLNDVVAAEWRQPHHAEYAGTAAVVAVLAGIILVVLHWVRSIDLPL